MDSDPVWIEKFISLIEKKPVLYNKASNEYADRDKKKKAWVEVCEEMIENWEDLSPDERQVKGNDVQGRWKNLRTCFARELRAQKTGVSGQAAKKRRKYIYFEQLMFLLPTIEDRETASDLTAHETPTEAEQQLVDGNTVQLSQDRRSQPGPSRSKKRQASYEETLLNILQDKREEIDEDKSFLLSLLPAMKRMRKELKCEAKIEMLRIVNKYKLMDSHPVHQPQTAYQFYPQRENYSMAMYYPTANWQNTHNTSAASDVDQMDFMTSVSYRSSTPSATSQRTQSEKDPSSPASDILTLQ